MIINNQPTDKVQRPVGYDTMKTWFMMYLKLVSMKYEISSYSSFKLYCLMTTFLTLIIKFIF